MATHRAGDRHSHMSPAHASRACLPTIYSRGYESCKWRSHPISPDLARSHPISSDLQSSPTLEWGPSILSVPPPLLSPCPKSSPHPTLPPRALLVLQVAIQQVAPREARDVLEADQLQPNLTLLPHLTLPYLNPTLRHATSSEPTSYSPYSTTSSSVSTPTPPSPLSLACR